MTPEDLAKVLLNELGRQRDEHEGPTHLPAGGIGWLDDEYGLTKVIVDGQVDLVALAQAAILAIKNPT